MLTLFLVFIIGGLFCWSNYYRMPSFFKEKPLEEKPSQEKIPLKVQIEKLLPQTQCGRCGYKGCREYATAIAQNLAPTHWCPPGGEDTRSAISKIVPERSFQFSPIVGQDEFQPQSAKIDTDLCIGCALCTAQCPTAAIIGTRGSSHSVINELCTGCDLCVDICPTSCIKMENDPRQTRSLLNNEAKTKRNIERERHLSLWNAPPVDRRPQKEEKASKLMVWQERQTAQQLLRRHKALQTLRKLDELEVISPEQRSLQTQLQKFLGIHSVG